MAMPAFPKAICSRCSDWSARRFSDRAVGDLDQARLAAAHPLLGLPQGQFGLLAVADVPVQRVQHLMVDRPVRRNLDPAAIRQRDVHGNPQLRIERARHGQAGSIGRHRSRLPPVLDDGAIGTPEQAGLVPDAVERHESIVDIQDPHLAVEQGRALFGLTQQRAVLHGRQAHERHAGLGRRLLAGNLLPHADATACRIGHGHDLQPPAVVLEHEGLGRQTIALDTVGHVTFEMDLLFLRQTSGVKAPQVLAVVLARMNQPVVLGEKNQKCVVPQHSAILCVENAESVTERIQQTRNRLDSHVNAFLFR